MTHNSYSDRDLRRILCETTSIALVGASQKPERPSFGVMQFLLKHGYSVSPINPGLAGQYIHEQLVHDSLAAVTMSIDMVDVFRNSREVSGLVDEVLALKKRPKFIWMQLGVFDLAAAKRAELAGIEVVMNRCPVIEISRLQI